MERWTSRTHTSVAEVEGAGRGWKGRVETVTLRFSSFPSTEKRNQSFCQLGNYMKQAEYKKNI